jgi:hypothetical protein
MSFRTLSFVRNVAFVLLVGISVFAAGSRRPLRASCSAETGWYGQGSTEEGAVFECENYGVPGYDDLCFDDCVNECGGIPLGGSCSPAELITGPPDYYVSFLSCECSRGPI